MLKENLHKILKKWIENTNFDSILNIKEIFSETNLNDPWQPG